MKRGESGLKDHPFFAGADRSSYQGKCADAKPVRMEAGAIIYREGGESSDFYIIEQGRVALEACNSIRQSNSY